MQKISFAWGKGAAQAKAVLPWPELSTEPIPPPSSTPTHQPDATVKAENVPSPTAAPPPSAPSAPSSLSAAPSPAVVPSPPSLPSPTPSSFPASETPITASNAAPPLPSASPSPTVDAAKAVDEFLAEETLADRMAAITRVLSSFLLNPFDVLGLPTSVSLAELNKHFRALSLLIHPDKVSAEHREQAQLAFARVSDARAALLDPEKREALDEVVSLARQTVITERERDAKRKLPASSSSSPGVLSGPPYDATRDADFDVAVSAVMRELLIDREWRKRQLMRASTVTEGREQAEREERQRAREEKAREDEEYESKRGERVASWRTFVQQGGKSKKQKRGGIGIGMRTVPRQQRSDEEHLYVRRVLKDEDSALQ